MEYFKGNLERKLPGARAGPSSYWESGELRQDTCVGLDSIPKKGSQHYHCKPLKFVARPGGFEPPAKSLEGSCSIHLSYERVLSL